MTAPEDDQAFREVMADLDRRLVALRVMFDGRHATAIDAIRTVVLIVTAAATAPAEGPDRSPCSDS